jgi:uncharacterized cupin superfamily protein
MNLLGDDWSTASDRPGFRWRRMRVAGERVGASLYELPPGERTWPYHYEIGNEELVVVMKGRPTLRDPHGERILQTGDCVLFPQGPEGAHQLINRSHEPARVLIVSNFAIPRAAFRPETGMLMIRWGPGPDDSRWFREEDAVDLWEGED